MRILAVDTSGPSQSVAVLEDERCLKEVFDPQPPSHSETLLASIQTALDAASWSLTAVDLFAVTEGPGSFTGLRIGLSTVKGLCRALGKPVAGVSTLLALTLAWLEEGKTVVACLDARCGEVYAGGYTGRPERPEQVLPDRAWPIEGFLQNLSELPGKKFILGDGLLLYRDRFLGMAEPLPEGESARVRAASVGRLGLAQYRSGKTLDGPRLQAHYLRVSEAENRLKKGTG